MTSISPIIVSASRSTDIPAFYSKWFVNRIKAGYCVWYNPFNRQPTQVRFDKTKVVVFWTKNPKPLIPLLRELDDRGILYYFQFTLNDYQKELLEPNVPNLSERIDTFKRLSDLIGKEKVIWRFDPLILTSTIDPDRLIDKMKTVGDKIHNYTEKLVFSFADIVDYKKVRNNLTRDGIDYKDWDEDQMNAMARSIMEINKDWNLEVATCAEKIDLDRLGIKHNRCIDGELMKRIFKEDKDLVYYLTFGRMPERTLFGDDKDLPPVDITKLKDKGQRKTCGCMISKDIGMYNTCLHLCEYCYANTSKEIVMKNRCLVSDNAESIIKG